MGDDQLASFVDAGGAYIVLLVDQLGRANGEGVQWNRDNFLAVSAKWKRAGVERVGGWFNGWAGDAPVDAQAIADFVHANNAGPVMLDLEGDYKGANAWKMPALLQAVRDKLPTRALCVSTPGQFDNALIWNGRTLNPPRSFFDLGCRWAPQWYSSYYQRDGHTDPVFCMQQLHDLGNSDGNYKDQTAPDWRGLPSSYAKGTLEVTGLEGSSLADELGRVKEAKRLGLLPSKGISIYLLENLSDPNDWTLLKAERGTLYV